MGEAKDWLLAILLAAFLVTVVLLLLDSIARRKLERNH